MISEKFKGSKSSKSSYQFSFGLLSLSIFPFTYFGRIHCHWGWTDQRTGEASYRDAGTDQKIFESVFIKLDDSSTLSLIETVAQYQEF